MRPIDADELHDKVEVCYQNAPTPYRKIYSDFLDLIADAPTIPQPSNAPLTLEELREMDGEPVWVEFPKCSEANGWMLVSVNRYCVYDGMLGDCDFENCGKTWLAYRRKPEEGTK